MPNGYVAKPKPKTKYTRRKQIGSTALLNDLKVAYDLAKPKQTLPYIG